MTQTIGILNWFDESPAWLAACVASMARAGMSHIVAVDGAYAHYPDGIRHPRSGPEQAQTISEVCQASQIGSTIYTPAEAWHGDECEKRSYAFRLAELVAEPGDWYFLMDADQVITTSIGLHETLAAATEDVAEVMFYERGTDEVSNGQRSLWAVRCVFRAAPGLRVVGRHMDYVLPDGTNLWGDPPLVPAVVTMCEVEHRSRLRSLPRRRAQLAYYQRRDEAGIEMARDVRDYDAAKADPAPRLSSDELRARLG